MTSTQRIKSVLELVVSVRLVVVVAVEHGVVDQLHLLPLLPTPRRHYLLSRLPLPDRRRGRPLHLPHEVLHQSRPEPVQRTTGHRRPRLLRVVVQRVANRFVNGLWRRSGFGLLLLLHLARVARVHRISLHFYVLLNLVLVVLLLPRRCLHLPPLEGRLPS